MLAFRRHLLVPLFIAVAIASGGAAGHATTIPPAHAIARIADPICPASTNWDALLRACV